MRLFARRFLTLATLAAIGVLWSGCTAKEQSEYVSGISTQMNVPRDLRAIRVSVSVGGFRQFCRGYPVYEGKVTLPKSLGIHALNDPQQSGPVTFSIVGYDRKLGDGTEFADEECDVKGSDNPSDPGAQRGIRLLRRSRQPYVKDQILFLPMPLKYACMDQNNCADTQTCKAGRCVDGATDPATLPEFNPDMIDGNGGACFRATECFAAAAPAIPVDPETCTYAVANTKDEPPLLEGAPDPIPGPSSGDGVNVAVTWDGGYNVEILDKEKDEGFIIPDPTHPQRFQLTQGLCDMVKGFIPHPDPVKAAAGEIVELKHRITAIRASGTCQAKSPFQPICNGDMLKAMGADKDGNAADTTEGCKAIELKPPKALLSVIIDNTQGHQAFFDEAPDATVGIPLSDPAFEKTDIGLIYAPGSNACDLGANATIPPQIARDAKTKIIDEFKKGPLPGSANTPWALDGALARANALATGGTTDYYKRAVLVIGNRFFGTDSCIANGPNLLDAVPSTTGAKPVQTYVILLAQPPQGGNAAAELASANLIAQKGGTIAATEGRGAGNKTDALKAFQTIVKSLATCVYDIPQLNAPLPGDILSYTDPLGGATKTIPHNAGCNSETAAADGWGTDTKKIFVCGNACESYRTVLSNAGTVNAGFKKAAPPVPIFAHKALCAPKPAP